VNPTLDATRKAFSLLETCGEYAEAESVAIVHILSAEHRGMSTEVCYWIQVRRVMQTVCRIPAEIINNDAMYN